MAGKKTKKGRKTSIDDDGESPGPSRPGTYMTRGSNPPPAHVTRPMCPPPGPNYVNVMPPNRPMPFPPGYVPPWPRKPLPGKKRTKGVPLAPMPRPLPRIDTSGAVTNLFQHTCPQRGCPDRYSLYASYSAEQHALERRAKKAPIVHRQAFNDKQWSTVSFTINAPEMRALLRTALAGYKEFNPTFLDWEFSPPFKPIVHRWDRLVALANSDELESKSAFGQGSILGSNLRLVFDDESLNGLNKSLSSGRGYESDSESCSPASEKSSGTEVVLVSSKPYGKPSDDEQASDEKNLNSQEIDEQKSIDEEISKHGSEEKKQTDEKTEEHKTDDDKEQDVQNARKQKMKEEKKDDKNQQQDEKPLFGAPGQRPIDLLLEFLAPIIQPSVVQLERAKKTGKISFDDIWTIFPSGELVVTTFYGVEAACRVVKCHSPSRHEVREGRQWPYWVLTLKYIDWDGERCGRSTMAVEIGSFTGQKRILDLPAYPLSLAGTEREAALRETFLERGRKFEKLRGSSFQEYSGSMVTLDQRINTEKQATGRVVIDAFAYHRCGNSKPRVTVWDDSDDSSSNHSDSDASDTSSSSSSNSSSSSDDRVEVYRQYDEDGGAGSIPQYTTRPLRPNKKGGLTMETAVPARERSLVRNEKLKALTDEQLLVANPWMVGWSMNNDEWGRFCIDQLRDIKWDDGVFDNLIVPGNEKEMAWSFVQSKALSTQRGQVEFDDFVPDKGRGIIILLFGPPGVGKTYTAEAVAERARVPLLNVRAGALGSDAANVSGELDDIMMLCKMWNAILLLDEADVFLGARTDTDITRNELVALFLTKIEYHQGICFLTTNRVSKMDHAFQSRVDLFLPYYDLTADARRKVWTNFMNHLGMDKFEVTEADMDKLSAYELNGREIKNLIKSAHLLSLSAAEKITAERLSMLASGRIAALKAIN